MNVCIEFMWFFINNYNLFVAVNLLKIGKYYILLKCLIFMKYLLDKNKN